MDNLLRGPVEYRIDETPWGVWRRFLYTGGELFEEFTSHRRVFGVPLLHFTRGKCPETGRRVVAKGIVAVGRIAVGQLALSPLLGIGQASTGIIAVGQLAIAAAFGIGQAAAGYAAIAQFGLGHYVLAQLGLGEHVWDVRGVDPAAVQFFKSLLP